MRAVAAPRLSGRPDRIPYTGRGRSESLRRDPSTDPSESSALAAGYTRRGYPGKPHLRWSEGFFADAKPMRHSTFPHAPKCLVAQHETREKPTHAVYTDRMPQMRIRPGQIT